MARERLEKVARKNVVGSDAFRQDLLNIARTTLSSKILTHDKDHFAELAVDAVLRLKGSTDLEAIHIIKKTGGTLKVCHLDLRRKGLAVHHSWLTSKSFRKPELCFACNPSFVPQLVALYGIRE